MLDPQISPVSFRPMSPEIESKPSVLITGCGRSGTGYLAALLSCSGINTSHERYFNVFNIPPRPRHVPLPADTSEASWYAVPWLKRLSPDTKVIHIVRSPFSVVRSFYRIGIFSDSIWRHINYGHSFPVALRQFHRTPIGLLKRTRFALLHRQFVRHYCSFDPRQSETERLWSYWINWNQSIDSWAQSSPNPYTRLRLEDVSSDTSALSEFLGTKIVDALPAQNTKDRYRSRVISEQIVPDAARILMNKYGY